MLSSLENLLIRHCELLVHTFCEHVCISVKFVSSGETDGWVSESLAAVRVML